MAVVTYEPVDKDDAVEQIAVGMHTGLRKGSEAPSSGPLWQAISASDDTAWSDAARYCVWGLESMGYVICRKTVVIKGKQVES
jgi:hypothetical protein